MVKSNSLPFRVPAGYQGPKRSLILAGGGMRLAYQAGVLKALEEHGLCFHHADGTSGGIFNVAMLLSGLTTDQICQNWRTLRIKDFVSYFPFKEYLNPFRLMAFGDADGLLHKVFPHLGINITKINTEPDITGTFNVCNYSYKINEAIPHQQVSLSHLIAGVSLPIFMPAVQINNDWYIDAVWIKDANLMEAIKRGAEEIWLVWAIGNEHQYRKGSFNQYVHMIEMSANGALFAEFDYLNELNNRIRKGDSPYGQKNLIQLHIVKPEYPLPLDTDLYFNKINTTTLIDLGYADAKNYLLNNRKNPAAPSPHSTKMKSPGVGFSLRFKLTGNLFNQITTIHLSLTLPDIAIFMQTEEPYQLAANIYLSQQSRFCYGYNGTFFTKNNADQTNKQVEFGFQVQVEDQKYYLRGQVDLNADRLHKYQIPISLYQGASTAGTLLSTTIFTITPADYKYFRKSLQFYHTPNWWAKRKASRALQNYFLTYKQMRFTL
ncbi:patatin-like phospholipase family protein [Adhaeribacter radiodurans]|uniref:Patatin-like phospholipase family protein n=1 Tax=Adhaeribacter radiodurans TaxID=2745197 RepID=A0A7L7LAV7_9BACT|nr:patatin-like phospholipase family protein [Adhaeribacter radiodurans]QMU29883.1 patatin-like phospholipase family protein [Adhaeribacter radiodurans]